MKIIECEQRSPEWFAARRGIPTASEFGKIITPAKMLYAAAADEYINSLIDEMVRPDAVRGFGGNRHTERGCFLEDDARQLYAFERNVTPRQVGFITSDDGLIGCSPDSLIDPNGGLEIKCPDGPTHVRWLRGNTLPDEYRPQVHGCLVVTDREWWDFMSYCPGYPPLMVRAVPNAFTAVMRDHLNRFTSELANAKRAFIKDPT